MYYIKTFFMVFLTFGVVSALPQAIVNGPSRGVMTGLAIGSAIGFAFVIFNYFLKNHFTKNGPKITNGKNIIKNSPAVHYMRGEGVGGWLFLTEDNMVFKSHILNIKKHQLLISLNSIKEAKPFRTYGLIPNGMIIEVQDGTSEKFIVENRDLWIEKIKSAISSPL